MTKDQRLADLRKSISKMSVEELTPLLKASRDNRRPPAKKIRKKAPTQKPPEVIIKDFINLHPEKREELLLKIKLASISTQNE